MDNKNQGLNERLAHKQRIKRMKTGMLLFVLTWMLVCMLVCITLLVKVHSLQDQIDILTESTIRSQQIGQQQNQAAKSSSVAKYEAAAKADSSISDSVTDTEEKQKEKKKKKETLSPEDDDNLVKAYLTFDDGPSVNTERILDILDQQKVKATFFVTGREDEESLRLYKEIVDRGHTIGMHSYSHRYEVIYSSLEQFQQDFALIKNRVENATGKECWLYRFPGGSSNRVSAVDMNMFIRFLNKKGITYFDWNVQCGDATILPYTEEDLTNNVMCDIGKYQTSVILMHDAENKPDTVEALSGIIDKIRETGAVLLPITEKTKVVQHVSAESVED